MPLYRSTPLILVIIVVTTVGGTLYGLSAQDDAMPLDAANAETTQKSTAAKITVYVSGAVNNPGLVTVAEGARVAEAINASGGLLPTADGDKVNMAQILTDGMQVMVPEKTPAAAKTDSAAANNSAKGNNNMATNGAGLININTASEQDLDKLPGIGPAFAKRIIEYRDNNGGFKTLDELKKVNGIGEAKFNKLKDKICL